MPYSVEIGNPIRVYDVVVRKPVTHRVVNGCEVYLRRSDNKHAMPLCVVFKGMRHDWDVVVSGDELVGPRLIQGFATIQRAYEYAIQIRPDINRRGKDSRGQP